MESQVLNLPLYRKGVAIFRYKKVSKPLQKGKSQETTSSFNIRAYFFEHKREEKLIACTPRKNLKENRNEQLYEIVSELGLFSFALLEAICVELNYKSSTCVAL